MYRAACCGNVDWQGARSPGRDGWVGLGVAKSAETEIESGGEGDSLIECRLTELLAERGMTLSRLSELVDVSIVNLSILKTNKARAIRFSTLQAICLALECQPGDLLVLRDSH